MITIRVIQNRTEFQQRVVILKLPNRIKPDYVEQYIEEHDLLNESEEPWTVENAEEYIADWGPLDD